MRLQQYTPEYADAYERFLLRFDESLIYYSLRYKVFLEDLLDCAPHYWLALNGDDIAGVLPLMAKDGPWGRALNSLPYYGSNGGVIAAADDARRLLYGKYEQLIAETNVIAANLIDNPIAPNSGRFVKANFGDERFSQVTSLLTDGDPAGFMMSSIDSTARRNVRKAEKSYVSVRVDNTMMDFVCDLHHENMSEIGGNPKSNEFFSAIQRHFKPGEDFKIFVAEYKGEPVSALLLLYYHKTVEYFTPVTKRRARNLQPMALIIFRAMIDAIERGYERWNWGGTWLSQEGVRRFKNKWAAQDVAYHYYTQVNDMGVLERTPHELLEAYPGFYLVPFNELVGHGA